MESNFDNNGNGQPLEGSAQMAEGDIVKALVKMYSATTPEERNQYYSKLVSLGEDRVNFIKCILSIIGGNYNPNEMLSVTLFFKSYLNNLVIKKLLSAIERKSLFEELLKVMFERDLPNQILVNLSPCLESILFFDESDALGCQHLTEVLFQNMMHYIDGDAKSTNPNVLRVFFSMFKVAINVIQDVENLSEKMKMHNEILCEAAEKMIVLLKDSFNQDNPENAYRYSSSLLDWTILSKDAMNKVWRGTPYQIEAGLRNSVTYSFIDYLTTDQFMKVAYDTLFIGFQKEVAFFESGDQKLNEIVYACKCNIVKIISNLMTIIKPHLHMEKLRDTTFVNLLSTWARSFLDELLEFTSTAEYENKLENQKLKEFVTTLLTNLSQIMYIKEFHPVFREYGFRLLTDIGFPFLRTIQEEKHEMMDNPAEFVKLALDTWDRQKYLQIKSQAAKFIETMGDKIIGLFVPMSLLTWEILEYAALKDSSTNLPILKDEYEKSKFLSYCSEEDMIDCSLLTLTMVSYALPKSQDLKEKFVSVIEKVTKSIMDKNSLLLNCRLTIMLGYYIDILYKKDESVFMDSLKLFIGSLSSGEEHLALAHQSADTLNTIINDNDIIPRIKPIINDILSDVSDCIMTVKIPDFFDFLAETFKFYREEINQEQFSKWIQRLVQRIQADVDEIKGEASNRNPFENEGEALQRQDESATPTTMAIQKCWSIIITILETETFIHKYLEILEDQLKFLFGLLSDVNRIEFDDDIVKAMRILINKSQQVSEVMKVLFPYLKFTFEKHCHIYHELFDCIKAYIKNDKEFVLSNQEYVENIIGFGVHTLFNTKSPTGKKMGGDQVVNGAIYLIQILLLLKTDDTSYTDRAIPVVLDNVIMRMKEKPNNKIIKRVLFGVIMASIISNFNATIKFLQEKDLTDSVFESILKMSVRNMTNPLERKLFAMSMTSLLTQNELPDSVQEKSPRIISKIIDILVKTTIDEAKKAKKKEKKKIRDLLEDAEYDSDDYGSKFNNLSSDFDSDLESSESENDSEDKENHVTRPDPLNLGVDINDEKYNQDDESTDENENDDIIESTIDVQSNFTMMKTGLTTFDEFEFFKSIISKLYKEHGSDMNTLISQLSEGSQNALKGLIQIKKIENENGVMHRKIVKARRKR